MEFASGNEGAGSARVPRERSIGQRDGTARMCEPRTRKWSARTSVCGCSLFHSSTQLLSTQLLCVRTAGALSGGSGPALQPSFETLRPRCGLWSTRDSGDRSYDDAETAFHPPKTAWDVRLSFRQHTSPPSRRFAVRTQAPGRRREITRPQRARRMPHRHPEGSSTLNDEHAMRRHVPAACRAQRFWC